MILQIIIFLMLRGWRKDGVEGRSKEDSQVVKL